MSNFTAVLDAYNPGEMFALHSIIEVAHALNYQLNQLMGPAGGTNP